MSSALNTVESSPSYTETADELIRLYRAYRVSWLNAQYHGHKFESLRRWSIALKVVAALSASAAFLASFSRFGEVGTWAIAGFSLLAAVSSTVQPLLGLDQTMNQYAQARHMHNSLFAKLESLIRDIRRKGFITEEQLGVSKLLLSWHDSLVSLDQPKEDKALTRRLTAEMELTFPTDAAAWDRF